MSTTNKKLSWLLAAALVLPSLLPTVPAAHAETATDPAPFLNPVGTANGKKVLFDNTHGQTAGAADWVIDGGFSDFANGLAKEGYYVKELRKTTPLTLADLQGYDVFVIGEANIPYKATEQQAMVDYVKAGGSIFFIGDHYNADRNKNRWDASEVFNGYRRGAWDNPTKGMSAEEVASSAMQGVASSDWLSDNFGIRFRFNSLGDVNATDIVAPTQAFGITNGVSSVAVHAGATLAITDPKKAKGLVYVPTNPPAWPNAVDQGVYNRGGRAEGPYAAVSKVGLGKAAFIGDSSPVEDATPKYLREENGQPKKTYDGWLEVDDAKFLTNTVNWLANKESYTSLDQVQGLTLDTPTALYDFEQPANSTEPQAEPWAPPAPGYRWWDPTSFKPGSYGSTSAPVEKPEFKIVRQATLPNAETFKIRVVADKLTPGVTVSNYQVGIYAAGGTQIAKIANADGTFPTNFGYSANFSLTADAIGHATRELTIQMKPGFTGSANLRLRQVNPTGTTNISTETVAVANVPAEPLPPDKPPVPKTISIAEARTKAAGALVTVEGVITTKPGSFGGQAFYLQDATGGIYVFQPTAGYNVGDILRISAKTALFNTEFELTDTVFVERLGTADVPAPIVVDTVNEANQGMIVQLNNVKIQNLKAAAPAGTFEFDAVAGTTSTRVRVDARTGLTLDQFPYKDGQIVTVAGASSIFRGVFQLKPRGLADFAADTVAPTTEATVSNQPNAMGWYREPVTITLLSSDNVAVASTEYQMVAGNNWSPYTTPVTIGNEGVTEFRYRSTDTSGNVEEAKSLTLRVDTTAPQIALTLNGNEVTNLPQDGTVTFNATVTDAGSGVQESTLLLDDQRIESGQQLDALTLGLGAHTVTVRAIDQAGNTAELSRTFLIETDLTTLHRLVDRFAAEGAIKNNGIRTSIHAKLDTAAKQAERGQVEQAAGHLQQLQKILGDHVQAGNVSPQAQAVLNAGLTYLLSNGLK